MIVLAPHVDDEMIGCYRLLDGGKVRKVIYFFDLTSGRREEARKCSKLFGFELVFCRDISLLETFVDDSDVLVVPNIRDNHVDHKKVNIRARKLANKRFYYSIDMNVPFDKLSEQGVVRKRELLTALYPTQCFNDAKYYLFESFLDTDLLRYVYITTSFEGVHYYSDAPDEVSFLRNPHRHLFGVKVKLQVFADDREIEFLLLKKEMNAFLTSVDLNYKSCEMIAEEIVTYLVRVYPNRNIYVEVNEDGENGSEVSFEVWK